MTYVRKRINSHRINFWAPKLLSILTIMSAKHIRDIQWSDILRIPRDTEKFNFLLDQIRNQSWTSCDSYAMEHEKQLLSNI